MNAPKDQGEVIDPSAPSATSSEPARTDATEAPRAVATPLFELAAAAMRPSGLPEMAMCIADEHPTLAARVLCKLERATGPVELWLPCLFGVHPRVGDRVLVLRPEGAPEPVVLGVVDGYRRRTEPEARAAHHTRLKPDEVVRIESATGEALLELRGGAEGAVLRVLSKSVAIEGGEKISIEADAVTLRARQGKVEVTASEDVVVQGEAIHLN
jgi:hypothetical protein